MEQVVENNSQIEKSIPNLMKEGRGQQLDTLHLEICEFFRVMMADISGDKKMDNYLKKIELTSQQFLNSFSKILKCNQQLVFKSRDSPIIRESTLTYFNFLRTFLHSKDAAPLDSKGRIVWYVEIQTKLKCCLQFVHNFKMEKDITNSPREQYSKVWEKIRLQEAEDYKQIKKEYKKMKKLLHIATSAALNQHDYELALIKKLTFGLSFPRYMIMSDSAKLRSFKFYRTPTIELGQKIWNIGEEGAAKYFSKLAFESIKSNFKIYIPCDGVFNKDFNIFEKRQNCITVRVLYNKRLCRSPKGKPAVEKIMVHMHGGGFVALSSRSTQNHTRKWSKQLDIPIFSIDYRMPPHHPFPQAPFDCFLAYKFITNHIHHYLNIQPKQVYLAGDSAGGNLACSLTGLILKNNEKIPSGIYLAYPATDIRFIFTHSRLYSITDPLLWPPMLLLCLTSYLNGDISKANDPLASPILLTQQYVNGATGDNRFPLKWPKTIVTVGNKDPLYDDSLMLTQRMVESNIECECVVYNELCHAYLSTELFLEESAKTIAHSIEHLRKIMS